MYRHELKYMINKGSAYVLRNRLSKVCTHDSNADSEGMYRVSSLYFDDYCDSAIQDNLSGQNMRMKFRIRIYNGNDTFIRLEKKVKHTKGCKKDSVAITRQEYDYILAGDYEFLKETTEPLLKEFYVYLSTRLLKPKVIVDYIRESYVYPHGNVRITMDYQVKYSQNSVDLFNEEAIYLPAIERNDIILEVKFTGYLPTHLKNMVQNGIHIQESISKYTRCRLGVA